MTIHIPIPLQDKRIRFIKLGKNKRPCEKGWQLCKEDWDRQKNGSWKNKRTGNIHTTKEGIYYGEKHNYKFDDPKLIKWINKGKGIGILCGKGSGNLIVIDGDKIELVEYIKNNLPETFKEHKNAHIYYWCPEIKTEIGLNKDGTHFGEIKSTGRQVKVYEDNNNITITTISKKEIVEKLKNFVSSDNDFNKKINKNLKYEAPPKECKFLDYCEKHKMPKGERHDKISRNHAFYVFEREDRKEKIKNYMKAQTGNETIDASYSTQLNSVSSGKIINICCGNMINFQYEYKIPFQCKNCPKYKKYLESSEYKKLADEKIHVLEETTLEFKEKEEEEKKEKERMKLKAAYERIAKLRGEKNG